MIRTAPHPTDSGSPLRPVKHPLEQDRLASLKRLVQGAQGIDPLMQAFAERAAELCQASIGLVSIVGHEEQRFLGCVGMQKSGSDRDSAFCAYTILGYEPMVVEDARLDARFRDNPFVVGDPYIRFYAGAPLLDRSGLPLGSVCVIDPEPRAISSKRLLALQDIARAAGVALEARRIVREHVPESRITNALQELDGLFAKFAERDSTLSGLAR